MGVFINKKFHENILAIIKQTIKLLIFGSISQYISANTVEPIVSKPAIEIGDSLLYAMTWLKTTKKQKFQKKKLLLTLWFIDSSPLISDSVCVFMLLAHYTERLICELFFSCAQVFSLSYTICAAIHTNITRSQ
jgi:hypothetical protein